MIKIPPSPFVQKIIPPSPLGEEVFVALVGEHAHKGVQGCELAVAEGEAASQLLCGDAVGVV